MRNMEVSFFSTVYGLEAKVIVDVFLSDDLGNG